MRLRGLVTPSARRLPVVLHVRRQDGHLVSRYQQAVEAGQVQPRRVGAARLQEPVRLRRPDRDLTQRAAADARRGAARSRFHKGSLVEDFADASGIDLRFDDLRPIEVRKESLGVEGVEVLRQPPPDPEPLPGDVADQQPRARTDPPRDRDRAAGHSPRGGPRPLHWRSGRRRTARSQSTISATRPASSSGSRGRRPARPSGRCSTRPGSAPPRAARDPGTGARADPPDRRARGVPFVSALEARRPRGPRPGAGPPGAPDRCCRRTRGRSGPRPPPAPRHPRGRPGRSRRDRRLTRCRAARR
jgi:hypothetical protein